jgi:hypothetical protein
VSLRRVIAGFRRAPNAAQQRRLDALSSMELANRDAYEAALLRLSRILSDGSCKYPANNVRCKREAAYSESSLNPEYRHVYTAKALQSCSRAEGHSEK